MKKTSIYVLGFVSAFAVGLLIADTLPPVQIVSSTLTVTQNSLNNFDIEGTGGSGTVTALQADTAGVIASIATATTTPKPTFSLASSSQFGVIKVDGTTITASGGVITSVGGVTGGTNIGNVAGVVSAYNLDQEYNVKTGYGAKGDGVTDDTAAINAAFAAYAAGGGGWVTFPPGIYISQWWHIPTNNANGGNGYGGGVRGAGAQATQIIFHSDGAGTNDGGLIDYRGNLVSFAIQHMWLNYTNHTATMPLIFTTGTLHIDDLHLYSENAGNVTTNIVWGGNGTGPSVPPYATNSQYSGYGSYMKGCLILDCGVNNYMGAGANGIVIENNYVLSTVGSQPNEIVNGFNLGADQNHFVHDIYELSGGSPITILVSNNNTSGLYGNSIEFCDFDDEASATQIGMASYQLYGAYNVGSSMNGVGILMYDACKVATGGEGRITSWANTTDGGAIGENAKTNYMTWWGNAGGDGNGGNGTNSWIIGYSNLVKIIVWDSRGTLNLTNGGFFSSATGFANYSSTRNTGYNTGSLGTTNTLTVDNMVGFHAVGATIVRFDFLGHPYETNTAITQDIDITIPPLGWITNSGTVTITGSHT